MIMITIAVRRVIKLKEIDLVGGESDDGDH